MRFLTLLLATMGVLCIFAAIMVPTVLYSYALSSAESAVKAAESPGNLAGGSESDRSKPHELSTTSLRNSKSLMEKLAYTAAFFAILAGISLMTNALILGRRINRKQFSGSQETDFDEVQPENNS